MTELADLQRRIWKLVTAPSGVAAALAETPGVGELDSWLASDPRASSLARLDVYAHAYFERIHDALAQDFPALAAALGPDGFHDLATAFLCVHPPDRPSLRHAGSAVADFLDRHPAAVAFRRRWPAAADLARLEWALTDAFDAPDEPPMERDDLAALAPGDWEALVLELHPSAQYLELRHPVLQARQTWETERAIELPAGMEPEDALVWRRDEIVSYRSLSAEESELLGAVQDGASFGALCERLATTLGDAEAPRRAAGWLTAWVEAGLLRAPSGRRSSGR